MKFPSLIAVPLLVFPVVLYNLLAIFAGKPEVAADGVHIAGLAHSLAQPIMRIPMVSGLWSLTGGDLMLLFAMAMLFVEVLRSSGTNRGVLLNHGFSMLLMIVCLIEFLLIGNFATSTFFLITMLTVMDVLAGAVVSIVSARRDFDVAGPLQ